ncbi:hypothetical protein ACFWM1_19785 [Nocardia sp. NPDC058379]|uniref:hypothetical protein n=1 Tax=unclassified Nocardia TaxID=2637762 RepID=UPI00364A4E1F
MNTPESRNPSHFPDDQRTTRSHAGETIEDTRNWPGLILIGLGLVMVGLALTAAGYGFAGWALIATMLCVVLLVGGIALVVLEHRRVKAAEGLELTDPRGH